MRLNSSPEFSRFDDVFITRKKRHADLVCPVPDQGKLEENLICESIESDLKIRMWKESGPKIEPAHNQMVWVRGKHLETPKHKTQ